MLVRARAKVSAEHVEFRQADLTANWDFGHGRYDVVVFSLVLEHIQYLDHVFSEATAALAPGGLVYIGELHPFKQYTSSKARFDTESGTQVVECFTHHISDFVQAGQRHGLTVVDLQEYFDGDDRTGLPRILALMLHKMPA
jgi:2-polyprenyl-3-methyl-5-hydroxy-6-metoxy-1,4-benzoquinol methylase